MAKDLVGEAVENILMNVVRERFVANQPLPPENELASLLDVSRPTMREAVRILQDRGVLRVVHGRGTYLQPLAEWNDVRSIVFVLSHTTEPVMLGLQLVEIRRMIEVGASGLAATNRTDEQVEQLEHILDEYERASAANDLDEAVRTDLAFHELVFQASGNPFISAVMSPLETALHKSRRDTTEVPAIRARAIWHHRQVFEAIKAGDAAAAKEAMRAHMSQTKDDLETL